MENDAPVVGPDAPTADSTGHCDRRLESANFRFARDPDEYGRLGVSTSASPRCLDGGDVDLRHRHHRLKGALCLNTASRKRIG